MKLDTNDRDGYLIMTALRGPDNDDQNLKSLFTAVIRGFVMDKSDTLAGENGLDQFSHVSNGAYVNTMENARLFYIVQPEASFTVSHHFIQHARQAFEALTRMFPEQATEIIEYWAWAVKFTSATSWHSRLRGAGN
jgi:hypothetical protein